MNATVLEFVALAISASALASALTLVIDVTISAVLWAGARAVRAAGWLDRLAAEPDAPPPARQVRGH